MYVRSAPQPGLGFAWGALLPAAKWVGGALIKGGGKRATRLGKDFANAQSRNGPDDQDYLAALRSRGGDITRYEFDNQRRPLEGASREAKSASGLFQVSIGKGASTPAEFFQQAAGAAGGNTVLLVGGAVIAGLLLWKMLRK